MILSVKFNLEKKKIKNNILLQLSQPIASTCPGFVICIICWHFPNSYNIILLCPNAVVFEFNRFSSTEHRFSIPSNGHTVHAYVY